MSVYKMSVGEMSLDKRTFGPIAAAKLSLVVLATEYIALEILDWNVKKVFSSLHMQTKNKLDRLSLAKRFRDSLIRAVPFLEHNLLTDSKPSLLQLGYSDESNEYRHTSLLCFVECFLTWAVNFFQLFLLIGAASCNIFKNVKWESFKWSGVLNEQ